ncbi:SGNH/GDSL hydrolase family protein [Dactylosporangium sucinum]|uniref:Lipase n=1 Tax=Dactylosporangium sucinum TaxID=1424081 RepID=A0A917TNI9_9ACTN|nr:SGNH/GDSL hydrolase family protein [Dactylosporangium sucinum]GGM30419.1 lipase [Dactylosporangium sucinum]
MNPLRVHVAVVVVAVAAVGAAASPAAAAAPSGRYVALGDSYTSGPLISDQIDLNCVRSSRNYPHLVAGAVTSLSLVDVSCGGATTGDILNAGSGTLGLPVPAQIAAVTAGTALVTVGIGGNDIGFSSIVTTCAQDGIGNPFGSPCKNRYTAGGADQLQARIAATAPKVAAVIQAVRAKAPNARIVVVGYPAIIPDSGNGCWPVVPFAFGDVPYLRGTAKALNSMLAQAAAANGARYADTYAPSVGHDVCKGKSTRWVEGLVPENAAAPFHPNAAGEQGMAGPVTAQATA